jgi:hypothetical protein
MHMSTHPPPTPTEKKRRGRIPHYDEPSGNCTIYMPNSVALAFDRRAIHANYQAGHRVTTRDQEMVKALRFFLDWHSGKTSTTVQDSLDGASSGPA